MLSRKPADERKAEIAAAVLRLADELGPDRLTTQAVADAVGLTQPAIFRHFRTKQDLWLAVTALISERLKATWAEALASSDDPGPRIEALILGQLRQIEAMPAIPSILFSRELQVENDDLRRSVLALMTQLVAMLTRELAEGQKAGLFDPGLPPEDGALLLVSLVQGLAMRWTLGQRGFALVTEGRRLLDAQIRLIRLPNPESLR
ncbi:TetR/AcrR family transcriptional regulator [Sedimentitalea nanhaiensis]|uniref:Transcriptional regulator, TetR family n=1 Tax=Sedimentitalea nanhaiensis TaxID=999627 RepID=A0A1I7DXJ1_9RHOB|nr:TetR family transcriptional regulator [Sedimentitalea nanhaiensis]SFU16399.1 transcriptional regulator, TetR family [Sedimentitalea nanhaiensis]